MSLTNIAALFSDIVETPQQRQQRLLAEGQASAGQFTGLPTGIRELAMGISSNIPRNVEAVRRFGVQAGLPMETQGEQLQGAMRGLNVQNPADQAEMVRLLSNIDPIRGASAAALFEEEKKKVKLAEQQAELAELQRRNLNSQITARDAEELRRETEESRLNTEREQSRSAMNSFIENSNLLNDNEKQDYINYVNSGSADSGGLETLAPMINRDEEIKVVGNAVKIKNRVTGEWEWDVPPESNNLTGYVEASSLHYNPASIARYNRRFADITGRLNGGTISEEQGWSEKAEAANLLLHKAKDGYAWEPISRVNTEGGTVITYQEIPDNPGTIGDIREEVSAINARNASLNTIANNGLNKVTEIRDAVQGTRTGEPIETGSTLNLLWQYNPGSDEWTLRKNIDTLMADLGLLGLQEARLGSSSGASGFGQLTQTEMAILQERIAAIGFGLNSEDFLKNLSVIESYLTVAAGRSDQNFTYNQYINVEPWPEVLIERVDK